MKLVPASITATVARLVGVNDKPMNSIICNGPQRYSGPGWYAFRHPEVPATVVLWAQAEDDAFIRLSDGKDDPARTYLSHKKFDCCCFGRLYSAAEVERQRQEREARR